MAASLSARLDRVVRALATAGTGRRTSRRSFLTAATLTGTALAVNPWGYLTRPQSAYAATCGTGARCSDGWSVMCCSINGGQNTCPPNTYAGGWWKADRSSFCGGAARYYIDCNALPGHRFGCHCNGSNCDQRLTGCNVFRYGQCNTQIHGVTAVVCRQISCVPPWQLYPGRCGRSSATDNNTAGHTAPCLTRATTFPSVVTYPAAPHLLYRDQPLTAGQRLTATDRRTTLVVETDGDVSLRNGRGVVWNTGTAGVAGAQLVLRDDGRLAVLDAQGRAHWLSPAVHGTGRPAARLDTNGVLSVFLGTTRVWQTRTQTP